MSAKEARQQEQAALFHSAKPFRLIKLEDPVNTLPEAEREELANWESFNNFSDIDIQDLRNMANVSY
jgi:hypothetical protein